MVQVVPPASGDRNRRAAGVTPTQEAAALSALVTAFCGGKLKRRGVNGAFFALLDS